MPGFPVLQYLLEFAETHVQCIDDVMQPFSSLAASFIYVWLHQATRRVLAPPSGTEPAPLASEHGVLASGPTREVPRWFLLTTDLLQAG